MSVPWYEWKNVRNRLVLFGRALQGVSPYRVCIEPDKARCPTGYCNFTKREIAANPNLFPLPAKDQYLLTKAVLVHEAGHRRFTTPHRLSPVVHQVANILEDERIERQMCEEFAGVRHLILRLSQALYDQAKTVDGESESPGEVVSFFLQLRWAERLGLPVKGSLSLRNKRLWQEVKPIVYDAWSAESSASVDEKAEDIVQILGLKETDIPAWVKEISDWLGPAEGERGENDKAEAAGAETPSGDEPGETDPQPFDGEVPPNDSSAGEGSEAIEPKPYLPLEEKVRPLVQELIEELTWLPADGKPDAVERGGRFSMRDYLRDRERPFLAEAATGKSPPAVALKVIIDHSASMNHLSDCKDRIESVAEAVMTLHLVCLELGIPHEVWVTPQGVKIADPDSGERGKALIAGLVPALCACENMGLAIKNHAVPMANADGDIKLVLCLTDGACNDAGLGKSLCQSLRSRVEVIGVLLDPEESTRRYVEDMFGQNRVIACSSEQLPSKIGNILRFLGAAMNSHQG